MDDEQLRSGLAAWLAPSQRIPVPDSSRIRRRARRRLTAQASAGALACACVATCVGLIFGPSRSPATNVTSAGHLRACASHDLAATWLPPAPVKGTYMEPPPRTYLLALRNIGSAACSLDGWPRLLVGGPRTPRSVTVEYRTNFSEMVNKPVSRVVEPTKLVLKAHQSAVSAVTVVLPAILTPTCAKAPWPVEPPGQGASAIRSHGARPTICHYTTIVISPLYPSTVPITQNYPPSSY